MIDAGRVRCGILISFCFVATALAVSREIRINQTSLKPGTVLRLEVPKQYHEAPTYTWRNSSRSFKMTWDNKWRAIIYIPRETPAGEETFYIDPRAPMNQTLFEGPISIQIQAETNSKEIITAPANKAALLENSDEEKESEVIREFLRASVSDETQYWRGLFLAPVPGRIISHFGVNRERAGKKTVDYHRGVDITAQKGDPVKAPNAGVVLLAKEFNFHGKTILLSHGQGVCSIYLHLDGIDIKEGEKVRQGQVIGRIGSTGFSTGPHLHWGVYVDAQPVDPEQWLREEF